MSTTLNDVATVLEAVTNLINGFSSLFDSMDDLMEKNSKLFSVVSYAEEEAKKIKKKRRQRRHQPDCKNSQDEATTQD